MASLAWSLCLHHNDLHPFGVPDDEVSRSGSSPSVWFSMAKDNGLAVCATVVLLPVTYKPLT